MSALQRNGVTPTTPIGVERSPNASTALGITAPEVLATSPVRLARISVIVAGTAPGAAYDATQQSDDAAGTEVFVIPNAIGVYDIDWPCLKGLVVVPGTGQTIAVVWY